MRSVIAAAVLFMMTVATQATGNAERGMEIAAKWCADCHQTTAGAVRLNKSRPATFQEIADTPGMGELALKVFFRTPHRQMPNFSITDETRDHLIAYITSLKRE
jgi:cytochrome c